MPLQWYIERGLLTLEEVNNLDERQINRLDHQLMIDSIEHGIINAHEALAWTEEQYGNFRNVFRLFINGRITSQEALIWTYNHRHVNLDDILEDDELIVEVTNFINQYGHEIHLNPINLNVNNKRLQNIHFSDNDIPSDFICPLTLLIMDQPVTTWTIKSTLQNGELIGSEFPRTYEEWALKKWLNSRNDKIDPLNKQAIIKITNNTILKNQIESFVDKKEKKKLIRRSKSFHLFARENGDKINERSKSAPHRGKSFKLCK